MVADLHAFYRRFHLEVYGHDDTPVHDALAVAHVIAPDVLTTERLNVEIDVTQGPCRGRTVVDQLRRTGREPNAHVAVDVDADGFIDLLCGRIGSLRVTEFPFQRRLGAYPLRNGRTEFRVWAPNPDEVRLRVGGAEHALEHAGYGIYEATVDAGAGRRLRVRARRHAAARPVLALAAGGPARARRGSSTRSPSSGPTAASASPACRTP